jgi:hypothetical protein
MSHPTQREMADEFVKLPVNILVVLRAATRFDTDDVYPDHDLDASFEIAQALKLVPAA